VIEECEEMTHRYRDGLLAALVLVERPGSATEELTSLALTEPELRAHSGDLGGRENLVDLGLQLEERPLSVRQRLSLEDRLVALGAPPRQHRKDALLTPVFDRVGPGLVDHRRAALGTGVG